MPNSFRFGFAALGAWMIAVCFIACGKTQPPQPLNGVQAPMSGGDPLPEETSRTPTATAAKESASVEPAAITPPGVAVVELFTSQG